MRGAARRARGWWCLAHVLAPRSALTLAHQLCFVRSNAFVAPVSRVARPVVQQSGVTMFYSGPVTGIQVQSPPIFIACAALGPVGNTHSRRTSHDSTRAHALATAYDGTVRCPPGSSRTRPGPSHLTHTPLDQAGAAEWLGCPQEEGRAQEEGPAQEEALDDGRSAREAPDAQSARHWGLRARGTR